MSKMLNAEPSPEPMRRALEPSGRERAALSEQLERHDMETEQMAAQAHIRMLERTDANLARLNARLERLEGQLTQGTTPPQQIVMPAIMPTAPEARRGNPAAVLVFGMIGGMAASYLLFLNWPSRNPTSPTPPRTSDVRAIEPPEWAMPEMSAGRPRAVPTPAPSGVQANAFQTATPVSLPASAPAPQQAAAVPADAPADTTTQTAGAKSIAPAQPEAASAPEPATTQTVKSADSDDVAHVVLEVGNRELVQQLPEAIQPSVSPPSDQSASPSYKTVAPSNGQISL